IRALDSFFSASLDVSIGAFVFDLDRAFPDSPVGRRPFMSIFARPRRPILFCHFVKLAIGVVFKLSLLVMRIDRPLDLAIWPLNPDAAVKRDFLLSAIQPFNCCAPMSFRSLATIL